MTTVATCHTRTANFWADFEQLQLYVALYVAARDNFDKRYNITTVAVN